MAGFGQLRTVFDVLVEPQLERGAHEARHQRLHRVAQFSRS
jgi:hypothetical protein